MSVLHIFAKGISGVTRTITISNRASIKEFTKCVKEEFNLHYDVRIIYKGTGQELQEVDQYGKEQFLQDYQVRDRGSIFLVLRLLSCPVAKEYGSDVKLAIEPDMFTLDDTVGGQRAKMPCGHVVGPESLTQYCRSVLAKGGFKFRCPYKAGICDRFCDSQWDLPTVTRMALLTDEELEDFEKNIAKNYSRAYGFQKCPKCKTMCSRKLNTDQCVKCPVCRNVEFCWFCLKVWKSSTTKSCGNLGCTGEDSKLNILRTCRQNSVFGVTCPSIRACPTCGILIEYIDKLNKRMWCPCGTQFCFICLKKASVNGWLHCASICEAAPVQTEIPTL